MVQWWDTKRTWFLVILLMICGAVIQFIRLWAPAGRSLKVRKIAGPEAVDEAVGRATEMGRSCLFVPGIPRHQRYADGRRNHGTVPSGRPGGRI
ncbi:MAG: hypothetical protein CM1200mP2_54480 [Planctomycetaceae bacterium]|nr:MAG: hypothetical protein CM1200mP2_54480 [Planctomycetaceae bacterium]